MDSFEELNVTLDMLMCSVNEGSVSTLMSMLDWSTAHINRSDTTGYTLLRNAVHQENEEIVQTLLKYGADANALVGTEVKYTAIHTAAETGNKAIVEALLHNGADCNARQVCGSEDGKTPLSIAIICGHTDVALLLIDQGVDVNVIVDQRTMLFYALVHHKKDYQLIVHSLLSHGADVNARSKDGVTALMKACLLGDEDIVTELLDRGARVHDANSHGLTALLYSVPHCRIVEILVSRGADVNVSSACYSPLIHAIMNGHIDTTRALLRRGASVNQLAFDMAPIFWACLEGKCDEVELLLDHGANVNEIHSSLSTPLVNAAGKGNANLVRILIERGADVNLVSQNFLSPLKIAVDNGDAETVGLILQSKPKDLYDLLNFQLAAATRGHSHLLSVFLKNCDMAIVEKILHFLISAAVGNNDIVAVDFLLKLSLDVHIPDMFNKYCNVIFTVVKNGQPEVLRLFINRGVDINVRNIDGKTLLIIAATRGHFEIVKLLVENGADVFATDNEGKSAAQYASYNGHSDLEEYLTHRQKSFTRNVVERTAYRINPLFEVVDIQKAAELLSNRDADVENLDGLRPLHFAARRGLVDLAQLLIDFGASVDATDSTGNTPLHEAARHGLDITKTLIARTKRVNTQNIQGGSPLHEAVQAKHFDVAVFLIQNGADPEIADNWMNAPFHYTSPQDWLTTSSELHLCSLLGDLSNSVKPNVLGISVASRVNYYADCLRSSAQTQTNDDSSNGTISKPTDADVLKNTELHRAVGVYGASKVYPLYSDSEEIIRFLLMSPAANLNARNIFGQTPLHVSRNLPAFKAILEFGRETVLTPTDNCGFNIWHLLASRDDAKQFVQLIEQVVPNVENLGIGATDAFGRTPLHYAVAHVNGDWYSEWLIKKAGKCETIRDCYDKTPLDYFRKSELPVVRNIMERVKDVNNTFPGLALNMSLVDVISSCQKFKYKQKYLHDFRFDLQKSDAINSQKTHFSVSKQMILSEFGNILKLFEQNHPEEIVLRPNASGNVVTSECFISLIWQKLKYKYCSNNRPSSSPGSASTAIEHEGQTGVEATYSSSYIEEFRHSKMMFSSIQKVVTVFMENLIHNVAQIDDRFKARLVPAGSSYEETKIDFCDEFDFIFELECFSELVTVVEFPFSPPGFVVLKMADQVDKCTTFAEFFNEDNILNTRLVKFRFEVLVKQVLSSPKFQKDNDDFSVFDTVHGEKIFYSFYPDRLATNIRMKFLKPINGQDIFHDLSIDVVPAIAIKDYWPPSAIQNAKEILRTVLASVPRPRCYLVFDQPQKKQPWVGWTAPGARVDFSVFESDIIRNCSEVVRQACCVVKQIAKNFCDFRFFKSYVIKAALMHCIMASHDVIQSREDEDWCDFDDFCRKLSFWVEKLMRRLLCFVLQDFVPSVFMRGFVLPVCSFETHIKFSHMRLHQSAVVSYKDLIKGDLMSGENINKLIDSQFEHIVKAFVISHLMYWSVLPNTTRRRIYFPPICPLYEVDYWPSMVDDGVTNSLSIHN